MSVAFLLCSFRLVEKENKELQSPEFEKSFGTIVDDIKVDVWSVFYYPIFLFQRLLYSVILIFLVEYPFVQISLIILTFGIVLALLNL